MELGPKKEAVSNRVFVQRFALLRSVNHLAITDLPLGCQGDLKAFSFSRKSLRQSFEGNSSGQKNRDVVG